MPRGRLELASGAVKAYTVRARCALRRRVLSAAAKCARITVVVHVSFLIHESITGTCRACAIGRAVAIIRVEHAFATHAMRRTTRDGVLSAGLEVARGAWLAAVVLRGRAKHRALACSALALLLAAQLAIFVHAHDFVLKSPCGASIAHAIFTSFRCCTSRCCARRTQFADDALRVNVPLRRWVTRRAEPAATTMCMRLRSCIWWVTWAMVLAAWARLAGAAARAASTIDAACQEQALNIILIDTTTLLVVAINI